MCKVVDGPRNDHADALCYVPTDYSTESPLPSGAGLVDVAAREDVGKSLTRTAADASCAAGDSRSAVGPSPTGTCVDVVAGCNM